MYIACKAPGGSNNISVYRHSSLPNDMENFPLKCYVVGENTYVPSEHLLTPFSGKGKLDPRHEDSYNYYLSQVRMSIEMSFGTRLVNKFRIF